MRTNRDLNEFAIDDSTLYMVNDLIFTTAGEMMKDVVEKTQKDNCNGECDSCECQDSDDEHGDNVEW